MPDAATKRLFVALFPPPDIPASLQAVTAGLARGLAPRAVRWTRPDQIHLTLHFLGAISVSRIPEIESALSAACQGHPPHKIRVAGLGCFPSRGRPQIIWAGLACDLDLLESLKKSIDARLLAVGCAGEDRPFHPHLTIGRVKVLNAAAGKQLAETLAREQGRDFGEWRVGSVDLMQSMLSPQGPAYSSLRSIALQG